MKKDWNRHRASQAPIVEGDDTINNTRLAARHRGVSRSDYTIVLTSGDRSQK